MQRIDPKSDSYSALMFDVICNAQGYFPKPGEIVLDLGAHFGVFSLFCAARGCEVYAFEPASFAFSELLHSCEVAEEIGEGRINPVRCAIWSTSGKGILGICPETTGSNSMVRIPQMGPVEPIDTVTLKEAMADFKEYHCAKFDVEGAEHQILTKAAPEDLARIKFLTLELHNDILSREQCMEVDAILRRSFRRVTTLPVKVQGKATDQVCAYYCWR